MHAAPRVAGLGLALLAGVAGAQVDKQLVTGPTSDSSKISLGFPPPRPVDSVLPVAGFRSYASLHARHQDLALRSPDLRASTVGNSRLQRPIWAYVLGDADATTPDGTAEPALLLNATIHAREWQAPEVATGILERFTAGADDAGLVRWLLDSVHAVVIPVHNIDGFLVTQGQPDRVYVGQDPGAPDWPRDGRMRRKNLRDSDGVYATVGDHLFGVDLNRNFGPFFGTNSSSSTDPRSLVHRAPSPLSEPESQALVNAYETLVPPGRLRFFGDLHSFSKVLFTVYVPSARTNTLTSQLAARFARHHAELSRSTRFPQGRFYFDAPNNPNDGIGTTSEYFGHTYRVPSWTLEIEPGENGAQEYGHAGWHHDGFVLPDAEIERVRTQLAESHLLVAYHVAGPAILRELAVYDRNSGELRARSRWQARADGSRSRIEEVQGGLQGNGRYRLRLAFDRPLRRFDASGSAQLLEGQFGAVEPSIELLAGGSVLALARSNGRWPDRPGAGAGQTFDRYRGDTYVVDVDLPAVANGASLEFRIGAVDAIGRNLDANPATVADWVDGGWAGYENTAGASGDIGGIDASHRFAAAAPFWLDPATPDHLGEGERLRIGVGASTDQTLALSYSGGLQGPAQLQVGAGGAVLELRYPDNLGLDPARTASVTLSGGGSSRRLDLAIQDNDLEHEWLLLADDVAQFRLAFAPALDGIRRRVRLAPGADYVLDGSSEDGSWLRAVRGRLIIEGQGARLLPAAGARALDVAPGGILELADLRIDGGGGSTIDGGQLRNRGTLRLDNLDSRGGRGRCGGAVWSDGALQVQRSSVVDAQAVQGGAYCIAGGEAELATSSVRLAQAGDGAALFGRARVQLERMSFSDNTASNGAVLAAPAGSVRLAASLLADNQGAHCSGAIDSAGNNVGQPRVCENATPGDRSSSAALLEAPVADGRFRQPLAAAGTLAANDPACAGSDQRDLPRPFEGACEPGAVERGPLPRAGLWWTPSRSGQGLDLRRAGDGLLVLLYAYEPNGEPITYTAQGRYDGARWSVPLLRWRQASVSLEPTSTPTGSLTLEFASDQRARARIEIDGQPTGEYDIEPFAFGPPAAVPLDRTYSGAGRHGLTYADHGGTEVGLLYAYGADQVLRWALADNTAGRSVLALNSFTGSCPGCAWQPPLAVPSGQLRLHRAGLAQPALDVELRFGVGAGGSVLLHDAVLERFEPAR